MALGFAEIPFLSLTAVVADQVVKAAQVRLLGIETTGNESLMLRLEGDVAAVETALAFAERRARELGTTATVACLSRPEPALDALVHFPNAQNPLFGGRDQLLPTDFSQTENQIMNSKQDALGILETQGLTAIARSDGRHAQGGERHLGRQGKDRRRLRHGHRQRRRGGRDGGG